MKIYLVIIWFILDPLSLSGQKSSDYVEPVLTEASTKIDSLQSLLFRTKIDTQRIELLIRMADLVPDPVLGLKYSEEAYHLSRGIDNYRLAIATLFTSAFKSNISGQWGKGLTYAKKGIELAKENNNYSDIAWMLNMVTMSYEKQKDYLKAKYYNEEVMRLVAEGHDDNPTSKWASHMTQCKYMLELGLNADSARQFAVNSILYARERNLPEGLLAYSYWMIGKSYLALHNEDSSRYYLNRSLNLLTKYSNPFSKQEVHRDLATYFFNNGHADSALFYAKIAYEGAIQISNNDVLLDASEILFKIYEKTRPMEAFNYLKLNKVIKDSLFNRDRYNQIYTLEAIEIQEKADGEKRSLEVKTAKQQNLMIFGAALFGLAGLGLGFIINQKQRAKNKIELAYGALAAQKKKAELALRELKLTQSQLIQSEKMASLGELTAGIAHEIQNPLNFVNNFSEVSTELVDEMNAEIEKGNLKDAKEIGNDLKQNLEKINHHGKRAGDIVKGMLQHSRSSSGKKEPTDINKLADEYLRLAYHGLRAKDKSFNATMKTDFDESVGNINIIPQDIGRVILNLFNNAFYVVNEKAHQNIAGYEPTVSVSTKKEGNKFLVSVKDNGNGIPQKILDKIFQPFFTTKPTGQGTGLGLSMSYDIVKAHGGELRVETIEAEGSTFIIQLPI